MNGSLIKRISPLSLSRSRSRSLSLARSLFPHHSAVPRARPWNDGRRYPSRLYFSFAGLIRLFSTYAHPNDLIFANIARYAIIACHPFPSALIRFPIGSNGPAVKIFLSLWTRRSFPLPSPHCLGRFEGNARIVARILGIRTR